MFGIPVAIVTSRAEALNAALEMIPHGRDNLQTPPAVFIKIAPVPGVEGECNIVRDAHMDIVCDGMRLRANGATGLGSIDVCDAASDEVLAEGIQTVVLFLVAHAGRIPLHASAIMLNDTAIVFAGPSGSGKSTLALAANSIGIPVLSDDTIFIQTAPLLRIWGAPKTIHVYAKDAPPSGDIGWRERSGRWKKRFAVTAPLAFAERSILCLLDHANVLSLKPVDSDTAAAELIASPEPGYEFYGERSMTAARAVASGGAWRLSLSHDPAEAIALVCQTLALARA